MAACARADFLDWNGTGTRWNRVGSWTIDGGGGATHYPGQIAGTDDFAIFSNNGINPTTQTVSLNFDETALGLQFKGQGAVTINNFNGDTSQNGANGNASTHTLHIKSGGMDLENGASVDVTFTSDMRIELAASQTWWNKGTQRLVVNSNINLQSNNLTVGGAGNIIFQTGIVGGENGSTGT